MVSSAGLRANQLARIVPLMECQAQEMAQGTTAMGRVAAKKVVARFVPSPAFCMPTSMLMVRRLAVLNRQRLPTL